MSSTEVVIHTVLVSRAESSTTEIVIIQVRFCYKAFFLVDTM